MVYTHKTEKGKYDLYKKDVVLKGGGKTQTIYFFTKTGNKPKSGDPLDKVPKGWDIGVNKMTGLPYLKRA